MTEESAEAAVELANRLNDVMRTLPPGTQPDVVMSALCAMLGRAIGTLHEHHKEAAYEWAMSLIRIGAGFGEVN